MRRRIVKWLLVAGVVLGFGGGLLSLARRHRHHRSEHREDRFVRKVARACLDAAEGTQAAPTPDDVPAVPGGHRHGRHH